MKIGILDMFSVYWRSFSAAFRLPGKHRLRFIISPVDITRFFEFSYLLKFLSRRDDTRKLILDVSSPVMLSYILARKHKVIKTDINEGESQYISGNESLSFENADATNLPWDSNSFDLIYSISVIEHIYKDYLQAISEMIRVVKPGSHVYLTFPVSSRAMEEWTEDQKYPDQKKDKGKSFFQYRFSEQQYDEILSASTPACRILHEDIFWERWDGLYDWAMKKLAAPTKNRFLKVLKVMLLNNILGPVFFSSKSNGFSGARSFGNAFLILEKKEHG